MAVCTSDSSKVEEDVEDWIVRGKEAVEEPESSAGGEGKRNSRLQFLHTTGYLCLTTE
jgi:hypothetical protein